MEFQESPPSPNSIFKGVGMLEPIRKGPSVVEFPGIQLELRFIVRFHLEVFAVLCLWERLVAATWFPP